MHCLRVAIAAVIVVMSSTSCTSGDSRFTVINETDEPIAHATIIVCGQTIEMGEIPVAGRVSGTFRAKADGDYDVSVQFADGKQLHRKVGYVTNGMRFADEIAISTADISVKSNPTIE
jgi:hypothetical protein